jgi:hypothetical protein
MVRITRRSKHSSHDSAYVESLKRHGNPANFTLHVVALPFVILGLLMHRLDMIVIASFYIVAGSIYAYFGPGKIQEIWLVLYKSNVNKWFTVLGFAILLLGLWSYDIPVILISITAFLFGLLYAAITE